MHVGRRRRHHIGLEDRGLGSRKTVRELVDDVVGGDLARLEPRLVHHRRQERDVVAQALDVEVLQRPAHAGDGPGPSRRPGTELGDHRVVVHRDLVAFAHPGVVAHGVAVVRALPGRIVAGQPADGRQELAIGVLRIDAAFHRPAVDGQVFLLERQGLAGGGTQHLFDQVQAGDQLGDRVLHLQAGVHFQEVEALVLAGDELHRAGGIVIHRHGQGDGLGAHGRPRLRVQQGRRRLLDDLLIAALD